MFCRMVAKESGRFAKLCCREQRRRQKTAAEIGRCSQPQVMCWQFAKTQATTGNFGLRRDEISLTTFQPLKELGVT